MIQTIGPLVSLYEPEVPPQIPISEKNALYEILNSVGKDPKKFYLSNNNERIRIIDNHIFYLELYNTGLESFPHKIVVLKSLKYLNLAWNKLKSLPPEIGDLENLMWLGLNNNQIESLPPEIEKIENLAYLNLEKNSLDEEAKKLCEKLKKKRVTVFY